MLDLIARIVPLAIGSTLSPGILALTVALLCGKDRPIFRVFALLFGGLLSVLLLTSIAYGLTHGDHPLVIKKSPILDIVIGVLLLAFGIHELLEKPDSDGSQGAMKKHANIPSFGLVAIGFLINITNIDAVLLYLTQLKEIFHADVSIPLTLAISAFSSLMFLLPSILPIVLVMAFPSGSKKILDRLKILLDKYGNPLLAALFVIFGAYFILRGIGLAG